MELARLGTDQRTGTIHLSIGPGEQVLEALHGSMHVLEQEEAGINMKTGVCDAKIKKRLEEFKNTSEKKHNTSHHK